SDPAGDELGVLGTEVEDRDPVHHRTRLSVERSGLADSASRRRPAVSAILDRRMALTGRPLARGAQLLGALEYLALGLDRRGDDELRLLQLADTARADGAHAGPDRPDEVERPVLGEGGPEEDLLERSRYAHANAGAAGQIRVRRRHAPVIAAAGGFLRARERGADHHGVGPGGQRLADIAARRHAAIGDDRHVTARPLVVEVPGGRGIRGGGDLGHADAEHLAARAGGAGADPDQQRVHARLHQLEARLVGDDVADDERNRQMLLELLQVDRGVLGGHVARRGHRGLHDEEVRARLFGDLGEALGALRDRRDHHRSPALLDLGDALVDQLFLDRLAVDALNDLRRLLEAGGGDAIEHGVRIFIAGEDPLEVDDREPPEPPHLDGEGGTHDAIHGGGDDGDVESAAAELPRDVHFVGIDGQRSRDESDIVETVRRPGLAPAPDPHAHAPYPPGPRHGAKAPYVGNCLAVGTVFRGRVYGCPAQVSTSRDTCAHVRMRSLPDHAQPFGTQVGIDLLQALAHLAHLLCEAARRDHAHVAVELAAHAPDEPVDEPGISVDDARLDIGDGVAADGILGAHDLHPGESSRAGDERIRGEHEAGRDRPTDEFSPRVDDVEIRGGAEVHDDERGAVHGHARDDIAYAVGPDLLRVVHVERHVDIDAGLDGERVDAEVRFAHPLERALNRRYHVRDGDTRDVLGVDTARAEQRLDEYAVL